MMMPYFFPIPDSWVQASIDKCGATAEEVQNEYFYNDCFVKTAISAAIFGAYFGLIIDSRFLRGTQEHSNDTSLWKTLARTGLVAILTIALGSIYFFINVDDMALEYILKVSLPCFVVGISLFSWIKALLLKLDLINP
mmetsp:Transcript_35614/g.34648  ORF Transcript_35614/g.34648 Transcript_35614/m.34648 type:complete len:138 (+) Transcript_35614:862-1275(+)